MELPGIGKKFTFWTKAKQFLSVVIMANGKREVFLFDDPDDDPTFHFLLNEEEAGLLGSILMGTYFKPEQDKQKELLLDKLSIEWVNIENGCTLAGKTIFQEEIRKKTGITIIAIIREEESIINPPPETLMKSGDTLIVVGSREQTTAFKEFFKTSM